MSAGAAVGERRGQPGEQPHRPQVDVLIEALAERQEQVPDGDVIGHRRRADRAEVDGVEGGEPLEAVFVHHPAVLHGSTRSPTAAP